MISFSIMTIHKTKSLDIPPWYSCFSGSENSTLIKAPKKVYPCIKLWAWVEALNMKNTGTGKTLIRISLKDKKKLKPEEEIRILYVALKRPWTPGTFGQ